MYRRRTDRVAPPGAWSDQNIDKLTGFEREYIPVIQGDPQPEGFSCELRYFRNFRFIILDHGLLLYFNGDCIILADYLNLYFPFYVKQTQQSAQSDG